IGSTAATLAEGRVTELSAKLEYYDTSFTLGLVDKEATLEEVVINTTLDSAIAGLALLAITALISIAFIRANIKKEPLVMLGGRNE
ncbi:MAG: hypothetical protein FWG48_03645, partial [Oscillospiraceae bacterium]|nr:hypothetical protein [Oscillospiraceae bacterium]